MTAPRWRSAPWRWCSRRSTSSPTSPRRRVRAAWRNVVNGFAWYALIAAAAGFLIGGACWAVGGRIGNDYTATGGKVGMAVSTGVAFLVGAAAAILNFAYNTGNS